MSPSSATAGAPIKCKAMVARGPNQPMVQEEITVLPPKAGEVRVKVIANALCHTDMYVWSVRVLFCLSLFVSLASLGK